jgi:lipoate-protein ligase A
MATDEALLQSAAQRGVTTLRFYGWREPTLSLGYFQDYGDRRQHAASAGCPAVRRRSGGGAIVHDRELTYSFATVCGDRFRTAAEQFYREFHDTLADVLADLGIPAQPHRGTPTRAAAFLCFQRRTAGDLTLQGQKITGSAQRRHRGGLLQHGSVLFARSERAPELPGIAELCGQSADPRSIIGQWSARLADRLSLRFVEGGLDAGERAAAESFCQRRFGSPEWTRTRRRAV